MAHRDLPNIHIPYACLEQPPLQDGRRLHMPSTPCRWMQVLQKVVPASYAFISAGCAKPCLGICCQIGLFPAPDTPDSHVKMVHRPSSKSQLPELLPAHLWEDCWKQIRGEVALYCLIVRQEVERRRHVPGSTGAGCSQVPSKDAQQV